MTSAFSTPDPVRCKHYARFAAQLDRLHFDIIYWILFFLVITMLCCASAQYMSMLEAVQGIQNRSKQYRNELIRCMVYCSVYTAISVVAVVLEVFVLMALQFCDGEDLMSIYWSTWTMLQVGSLIAVMGILLHVFHMLRGRKHPPWALALGTPVLVVAGIGHVIHASLWRRVKRLSIWSRMGIKRKEPSLYGSGISMTETIHFTESNAEKAEGEYDGQYEARVIGFTPLGGPILQFKNGDCPPRLPQYVQVLGADDEGRVTVLVKRHMTTVTGIDVRRPTVNAPNFISVVKESSDLEKSEQQQPVTKTVSAVSSTPTTATAQEAATTTDTKHTITKPESATLRPPMQQSPGSSTSSDGATQGTDERSPTSYSARQLSFSQPTLLGDTSRRGSSIY